jgi:hypothetical protein
MSQGVLLRLVLTPQDLPGVVCDHKKKRTVLSVLGEVGDLP